MVINHKTIFLLCVVFTIIVMALFGYVINKRTLPEKKICKVALKQCLSDADKRKKTKLNKCLEDRVKCGKEKKRSAYCRKQARECVSLSFKDGSEERRSCNVSYKRCLDKILKHESAK